MSLTELTAASCSAVSSCMAAAIQIRGKPHHETTIRWRSSVIERRDSPESPTLCVSSGTRRHSGSAWCMKCRMRSKKAHETARLVNMSGSAYGVGSHAGGGSVAMRPITIIPYTSKTRPTHVRMPHTLATRGVAANVKTCDIELCSHRL